MSERNSFNAFARNWFDAGTILVALRHGRFVTARGENDGCSGQGGNGGVKTGAPTESRGVAGSAFSVTGGNAEGGRSSPLPPRASEPFPAPRRSVRRSRNRPQTTIRRHLGAIRFLFGLAFASAMPVGALHAQGNQPDASSYDPPTVTIEANDQVPGITPPGKRSRSATAGVRDDIRGVLVTPTSLTVPEGGDSTYTVVLESEPAGTVTVTPSVGDNADVTVGLSPVRFTPTDWNQARTVTVSAGHDVDGEPDTATVIHAVSGADYRSVAADDVAVTVTDDDTASTAVELTVSIETVEEDAGATSVTVTGTLNGAPRTSATSVTVSVGMTGDAATEGTDYATVLDRALTIDAGQTSGTATFTLTPVGDDIYESRETLTVAGTTVGVNLNVTGTTVTITDNDTGGVLVTPTSLTVPEGGDSTYTVVLETEPTGAVTVTPSVGDNAEVTVSPSPLTFTPADWNQARTVTVSAADDVDAEPDTATVSHAVSGADYGSVAADEVAVTVADDETASTAVELTASVEQVAEGAGATSVTVTGTLNGASRLSATTVMVSVGASGDVATPGTDYAPVTDFPLTIDAGLTRGTATFTLTPVGDDRDEEDEALTVAGSTAVQHLGVTEAAVTIADDDTRGVLVTRTSLRVPEGGDSTYTVVLETEPTGTVTVTPSVGDNADVTVSPSPLTFTPTDWNQSRTVTVSAADDVDAEVDTATVSHAVSGADYGSVAAHDVAVRVTEDENASKRVELTVSIVEVDEHAGATSVTVTGTLNEAPRTSATSMTVSVGASGDAATAGTDYVPVAALPLTIDAGLTSGTATFTLTPVVDDLDEEDEALTVAGTTTVQNLSVIRTAVTIADDDTRGVLVTPTSLTVSEGGDSTYAVVLESEPTVTVTVTPLVADNSDVTVSPSPLTFTPSDWDQARTVTVSAVDDVDAEPDTATVIHAVSGASYGSVSADEVAVTVADDDTASTTVELTVSIEQVDEHAGATSVTVTGTLNGAPRTSATFVRVSVGAFGDSATEGTDYETVSHRALTIEAGRTSGTATFTLTPVDDDIDDDDEALTVAGRTVGANLDVTGATVTIADNDTRGVLVTPTSLTVPEGGDSTYTVVLETEPTGPVTVTPSVGDNADVTVGLSPVRFTPTDWNQARTVTVSAGHDVDGEPDTATVIHAVSGADYRSAAADDVAVTVADDDTASTAVELTVSIDAVEEGAGATSVTVTGTLNGAPRTSATSVTVSVGETGDAATEGTDYATVLDRALTIEAGRTSGTATLTLTPVDDDIYESRESLTVAGRTVGANLDVTGTTVTITDNDTGGVLVTPTSLTVPEGGDSTYTVVLETEPTGTVTVTPSVGNKRVVRVSPSALTFTPADWNQARTVTVSASQDADAEVNRATVSHAVSGGGYGPVVADDVAVTVDDDDTASTAVDLTVSIEKVEEGAGATLVTVTGTLNGAVRRQSTVVKLEVGETGDAAAEGTDYALARIGTYGLRIDKGKTRARETFTLTPVDDDLDEEDEALTVAGTVSGQHLDVTGTTVTIADNDTRGVLVTPTSLTVPEEGDSTYTVVLETEPAGTVTVTPSVGDNADVTVSPSPLTFTPADWNQARTVTVSAADDVDAEPDTATVSHAVSGADYGSVAADEVAVTVADDETASTAVELTVSVEQVAEGAGATSVTVTGTLNGASRATATTVMVSVGASGDDATPVADYAPVADFPLTIDAGLTRGAATFTLTSVDDDRDEEDEALTVAGSTAVQNLGVTEAAVTIADDDTRGVAVTRTSLTVPEGGDSTYTVVLETEPAGTVTVTPSVGDNADVTVSPSPLTFTPTDWDQSRTVTVSAADDGDGEADTATVSHAVSGADYGSVAAHDVAVRVTDDETASKRVELTVSIEEVEEHAGATSVTVTGTLNGAPRTSATSMTVSVGASGDAATAGTDYVPVAALPLTIDAGLTSGTATFTLTPVVDDLDEEDEALTVAGTTTVQNLSVIRTAVTIADDDTRGVLVTPTSLTVPEGGDSTYTVVLESEPTVTVTVTPLVADNSDVTVSPSPLTFTPSDWDQARTVTVSAVGDDDAEPDTATVIHALSGAGYGSVPADEVAVTVADDDTASATVELTVSIEQVDEHAGATSVTVTGTLNGAPRTSATFVRVSVGAFGDAATEGTDYETVSHRALTIEAGRTSGTATFTLTPVDDDIDDDDEALTVAGRTVGANLDVTGATVTIADNDTRGVVVTPTSLTVPEGGDSTYTVVLETEPTGPVTVTPSVGDNADVTVSPSPLTFMPSDWNQTRTVTVSAADDVDAEPDTATVIHAVAGADYGSVPADEVAVTVTDDDTASTTVELTVSIEEVDEHAGATSVTVTGTLNESPRTSATTVTVSVGAAAGDAATAGTDYALVADLPLTIDAGRTSGTATFTLTPVDDDLDEEDEALTVAGTAAVQNLDVTGTTVTIADNDTRGVLVTSTSLTVPEGGDSTYTVVLESEPTGPVTVTPSVGDNADVTVRPSPLTFMPSDWNQTRTVTVSAADDVDAEPDTATVIHTVSGADYGSVPADEVAVTVNDNDTAQVMRVMVEPGDSQLLVEWTAVDNATGYKVQWKSGSEDYNTGNRQFTVTSGSTTRYTIPNLTNGTEYTVRVIATRTGANDGTSSSEPTATPTLPELTIEDAWATEGAGVVFTVTLSRASTDAVTVEYSTSDDTATGGADYTTVSNRTLTLTAGSTRGTFTIATTPDALAENDETFTVTLSSPSSNAKLGTAQTATGTIEDDEGTPTLTIENALAAEGEDVEFTVNLSPASSGQVTVQYTTSAGTATSGTDYTAASARTLTIAAGATRATLTIATTEDTEDENDETFTVTLASSSANAVLGTAKTATGTIVDDDAPVEASSDATLVGLEVHVSIQEIDSSLTLTPAFDSETSRYTARTSQLPEARIELERSDDRASVVITDHFQELDLTTAENEGTVALVPGDNTVTVTVTAADGVTTRTYTIAVNTPDTPGSLKGAFEGVPESHDGSTAFEVRLRFAEDIATTLATLENAIEIENATLSNLAALDSSQSIYTMDITPSSAAPLRISVLHTLHCEQESHAICTAEGDRFKGTNRWVSTADDARLRAMWLVPEGGNRFPLNPVFDSDTTEYRAALAGEFSNLTLQAAPYNRGVTVTVTGPETPEVVDRWDGGVTATLSPPVGFSTWTVRVTAVDDVTTKTYTIAVIRSQPPVLDPLPPPTSLVATFASVPQEHDGESRFTVRIAFSEDVATTFRDMRDHVLTVSGGTVVRAKRVDRRKDLWDVKVRPSSHEAVTVELPPTASCADTGAVCTAQGVALWGTISTTIAGPARLSVADAQVQEGPNASLAFAVTLDRAASSIVTVDYATSDGTATAGPDYTAASGTLIFAPGETEKTVSVAVLDDAHDEGSETLTLTLSNPSGAYVEDGVATGTINNSDLIPRAWLARFGRTVADQVLDAVEGRMTASRVAGTELSVAGRRAGGAGASGTLEKHESGARRETLTDWLRGEEEDATEGQVTDRDFLTGSSFALTRGTADGGFGALWGRGAVSRFDGREGDLTLDGEVASALFGADWTRDGATAGFALAHSRGEGGYRSPAGDGEVESTLTGVYPWGRYEVNERFAVWGGAGYGAGRLTLTPQDETPIETDMGLAMAVVGGRSVVVKPPAEGGLELAAKSDALVVRTASDEMRGSEGRSLAASDARVTRLRLGLEGTWRGLEAGDGMFLPRLEVGVRHDGGDAETGFGADVGAGVAWTDPSRGLKADLAMRGLLTHEAGSFRERGFAGSLSWDPAPSSERGPSLTLSQTAGAQASGGMDALLGAETARVPGAANADGDELRRRTLEAKLGYGVAVFGGRYTGTPELGLGLSQARREVTLGWRLAGARRDDIELRFETSRLDAANDDREPEYRIGFKLTARW